MKSLGKRSMLRFTACTRARVSTSYRRARSVLRRTFWPRRMKIRCSIGPDLASSVMPRPVLLLRPCFQARFENSRLSSPSIAESCKNLLELGIELRGLRFEARQLVEHDLNVTVLGQGRGADVAGGREIEAREVSRRHGPDEALDILAHSNGFDDPGDAFLRDKIFGPALLEDAAGVDEKNPAPALIGLAAVQ